MRILLTTAAMALAATPGLARDSQRDRVPAATPTGEAVNCVNIRNIRSTHVRNDRVIDFEMRGGKVYRNVLPNGCPGLGFDRAFSYRLSTTQLCSVDIITVINNSGAGIDRGASCGLGSFRPVSIARR